MIVCNGVSDEMSVHGDDQAMPCLRRVDSMLRYDLIGCDDVQ